MRLVATDGHSHWVEPRLMVLWAADGYWYAMGVECDFGGVPMRHYITRNLRTGEVGWSNSPHLFRTIAEALEVRGELAARQPASGEE